MVVGHLSRLVPKSTSLGLPIGDSFLDEKLFALIHCPWCANIVNYLVQDKFHSNGPLNKRGNFLWTLRNITLMTHICLNTIQTNW